MASPNLTDPQASPRRKHRFRFSLRLLLVFVALLAALLGWYTNRIREQQRAVEPVRRLGGYIWYGSGKLNPSSGPVWIQHIIATVGPDFFFRVTGVSLKETKATDADLKQLKSLRHLRTLNLQKTDVTDAGLVHLEGLSELRSLHLYGTRVSDAGMHSVAKLTRLDGLSLADTAITDAGLGKLSQLTNMRSLYLDETRVTAEGLAHVTGMTKLSDLSLAGTQVHGPGLEALSRLPNLEVVILKNTPISDRDVPQLKSLGMKNVSVFAFGTQLSDAAKAELKSTSPTVQAR